MTSQKVLGLGLAGAAGAAGIYFWRRSQAPVVVVGGGVMGLSTAERLAAMGHKVLLLDENHPIRGSWGSTRASHLRMEDPVLLHMGIFSIRRWQQLQEEYRAQHAGGDSLFYQRTGSMMAGPRKPIENLAHVIQREIPGPMGSLEVLDAAGAGQRFPQLQLAEEEKLLFMPEGYTMVVPTALHCLHWAAARSGVEYEEDAVVSVDRRSKTVTTRDGREIRYHKLVITAGPWTNKVLQSAQLDGLPMIVSNEQTVEFLAKDGAPNHDWKEFPLFTWSEAGYKGRAEDGGCRYFYTTA